MLSQLILILGKRHVPAVAQNMNEFQSRKLRPQEWQEINAPRSIYLLPFLRAELPTLKFIHVLRDGRDMALSQNQNQLRKHGAAVLSWRERLFSSMPERAITLWDRVNLRAAEIGESEMGQN